MSTSSPETLHSRIRHLLEEEGYSKIRVDEDGDLVFKAEGGNYLFVFDAADPRFVRLMFPSFWPIGDESARRTALDAANEITRGCKGARLYVHGGVVSASVDLLVPDVASVDGAVVVRLVGMVQSAVLRFMGKLKE